MECIYCGTNIGTGNNILGQDLSIVPATILCHTDIIQRDCVHVVNRGAKGHWF